MGKLHHWILGCICDDWDTQQDVFLFHPSSHQYKVWPFSLHAGKTLGKKKSGNKVFLLFISRGDISVEDSLN